MIQNILQSQQLTTGSSLLNSRVDLRALHADLENEWRAEDVVLDGPDIADGPSKILFLSDL
jgi:hypothetical protein